MVLVLRIWRAAGDEPLVLTIDRGTFAKTVVQVEAVVPPATFCSLWSSVDLNRWQVWGSAFAPQGTVRWLVPCTSAACRFWRVERTAIAPLEEMVWVDPGEFWISSPPDEVGRFLDKEDPQTRVRLTRGYWINRFEVTQASFRSVLGFNPSLFSNDPARPVEDVTWTEAVRYCARLTEREREAGRLAGSFAYRLPTEAEWAYACRAGTTTRFSYGDDPGYEQLRDYAWYSANSGLRPHPVGRKLPNPWGIYDLHGNVFEWCSDWYAPLPGGEWTDPQGAESGTDRVIRGGYWDSAPELCRSAVRVHFIPSTRISYLGFRIVLAETAPPQAVAEEKTNPLKDQ